MTPMKRPLLLLATLGLVTLSGCAALQSLLKGAFQQPRLTFKTARLADASLSDATVNLVYEVDNPNGFGLSLASVDYAFSVEGKQVVAGTPRNGLQLKANGKSELVFPANVKFADLVPVVETFLTKDQARFKAQGAIGIKTPVGVIRLPLEKEGTFDVPKIPSVKIESPRITNLNLTGATVEFPLTVTNRNGFPLPVGGIVGALKVAGADVGTLSTGDLGMLDASGTRQLTLPLRIDFVRALQAGNALRSGNNAQVRFDGKLTSKAQAVPVDFNQLLNFRR
ncbi:LEA type 2 family protein [Myxococcaceae bacterium GXIMD 01537]